jgi:hypothetical protein
MLSHFFFSLLGKKNCESSACHVSRASRLRDGRPATAGRWRPRLIESLAAPTDPWDFSLILTVSPALLVIEDVCATRGDFFNTPLFLGLIREDLMGDASSTKSERLRKGTLI